MLRHCSDVVDDVATLKLDLHCCSLILMSRLWNLMSLHCSDVATDVVTYNVDVTTLIVDVATLNFSLMLTSADVPTLVVDVVTLNFSLLFTSVDVATLKLMS